MAASTNKRQLRHRRLRKKVAGTTERPRLAVHFSERTSTRRSSTTSGQDARFRAHHGGRSSRRARWRSANVATAAKVGKLVAERGAAKNVKRVVFDRGGFIYHGKVKALADAAREGGLEF